MLKGIQEMPQSEFDLILIDCPPNFNVVTKTAIVASDGILIPAKADYLSTLGIDYLRASLQRLASDYNEFVQLGGEDGTTISPALIGVVFTMIQEYGGQPIAAIRPFMSQARQFGVPVFNSYVKENKTLFADAPQYGLPVVLQRTSTPTHQGVIQGLEEVTTEFAGRIGLEVGT